MRLITVDTSSTPNPECLRFYSMDLSFLPPGASLDFPNDGHEYKSPLAQCIFRVPGVSALYFADEYITVTKEATKEWEDITPLVQEAIVSFAESDLSILSDEGEQDMVTGHDDTEPKPYDDEVVLAIKELLATRIRPMLQADGGNVRYIGLDEGCVYVLLEGACKTCPSSGSTLKHGIERMLMHWIPEVEEVAEVDQLFAEDFLQQEEKKRAAAEAEKAASEPEGQPAADGDAKAASPSA